MKPLGEGLHGLTFHTLFAAIVLLLPFWGYAVIPLGPRGILINWLLALGAAVVFVAQFLIGRTRIRDVTGTLLIVLLLVAVLTSVYQPLAQGRPGMLAAWTTTFAQYAVGIGLILVVINSRPTSAMVHRLLDLHILLAAAIAAFGVIQLLGSAAGLDLNLRYLNPGMRDALSSYAERTGGFSRATGLFEEPRQFGGYVVGALALSLSLLVFTHPDRTRRRRLTLACVILGAGLVSSLSASAILTAGLLLLVLVMLVPSARARRAVPLALLATGAAALYLFATYSDHVLATFLQSKLRPPDLSVMWTQIVYLDQGEWGWFRYLAGFGIALRTWATSPLVGVGLNNLEYYSVSLLSSEFTGAFGPVRFLAEVGLFGVISMSLLLGYLVHQLRVLGKRVRTEQRADVKGLPEIGCLLIISAVLRSAATNLYGFPSIFFWAEIGLGVTALTAIRYALYAAPPVRHTAQNLLVTP